MNKRLKKYLLQVLHYSLEHKNEELLFDSEREATLKRVLGNNYKDFEILVKDEISVNIFDSKKSFKVLKLEVARELEQILRANAAIEAAELDHVAGAKDASGEMGFVDPLNGMFAKDDRIIS